VIHTGEVDSKTTLQTVASTATSSNSVDAGATAERTEHDFMDFMSRQKWKIYEQNNWGQSGKLSKH
jgi:hypothetical protein